MLAGISAGYYMRLEQGRDHRPSEQVLHALARALQLDDNATAHLYRWAAPPPRSRDRTWRETRRSGRTCRICWTPGPPRRPSSTTAGSMCWLRTRRRAR